MAGPTIMLPEQPRPIKHVGWQRPTPVEDHGPGAAMRCFRRYAATRCDLRQWRLAEPSNGRDAQAYYIGRLFRCTMVVELCVCLVKQPLDCLARRCVGDVRWQPDRDRVLLPHVAHVSGAELEDDPLGGDPEARRAARLSASSCWN